MFIIICIKYISHSKWQKLQLKHGNAEDVIMFGYPEEQLKENQQSVQDVKALIGTNQDRERKK